jgi:hypothetical protein
MKVMVLVKANPQSEAGEMPSEEFPVIEFEIAAISHNIAEGR